MSRRCVIICSGGLDSTTVAAHARYVEGRDPILLHFRYSCQAETREVEAVRNIAAALGADARFCDVDWLRAVGGSTLTAADGCIAGAIEGAEYPHEWVPARNLIFMANAAALCDAFGIGEIYMGLNLEESAVYPDNTIEFFERMGDLLQVSTLVRPVVKMPIARMMKWEIVKHAYDIGAPIHLSWSCYRNGPLHCGACGPCYMRRTAHAMIGRKDPIQYLSDQPDADTQLVAAV